MQTLIIQISTFVIAAMISNFLHASATGFNGTMVTGAVYCCSIDNRVSDELDELTVEVGDGAEYGSSTIQESGENIIGAIINISNTKINIDYTVNSRSSNGSFNGYIFDFDGQFPEIKSISLNLLESTFDNNEIDLNSDSDTIWISLPGQRITTNSKIQVDVVFIDECIVSYTINGPLNIPCLSNPDETNTVFEDTMILSPWPGCDYLIVEIISDEESERAISLFEAAYEQECIILVVHNPPIDIDTPIPIPSPAPTTTTNSSSEAWTIAGFNDNGLFINAQIENIEDELIVELINELKKDSQNKGKIVEILTSIIGLTPSYEPLAYTSTDGQEKANQSFNSDGCVATYEGINSLRLRIPCISILESPGENGLYQAVLEETVAPTDDIKKFEAKFDFDVKAITNSQLTFKLISARKKEE